MHTASTLKCLFYKYLQVFFHEEPLNNDTFSLESIKDVRVFIESDQTFPALTWKQQLTTTTQNQQRTKLQVVCPVEPNVVPAGSTCTVQDLQVNPIISFMLVCF